MENRQVCGIDRIAEHLRKNGKPCIDKIQEPRLF